MGFFQNSGFFSKKNKIFQFIGDLKLYQTILCNSKFGKFDPSKLVQTYPDAMKANIPDMSDELYNDLARNEEWEKKNLDAYMEAIRRLSKKYPEKKLIIRPHPAEDVSVWVKFVEGLNSSNVEIVTTGDSIIPWLIASYKTISHNCTTSLESALLRRKSINFTPFPDSQFEWKLPLITSSTARSFLELESLLESDEIPKYDTDLINHINLKLF